MRIAYFDCFSGASGDMILAACLDAGLEVDALRADLAGLNLAGYTIEANKVRKQGFAATQVDVRVDPAAPKSHRHLRHVREIIEAAALPAGVGARAVAIFERLAMAEAAVHGTTIEKVHFHEVGAIDAIVDIVGASIALHRLGVERVECSPIPTGSGTVQCEHGTMPVPAPATAELLKGAPIAACEETGELTTPTGAAILTTLAERFGPMPAMRIGGIGIGAGRREGETRANILRLMIGEAIDGGGSEEQDEVLVLEANLDDVPGEVIGHAYDRLFAAGALDVFTTPITMKKNRPATLLTVLASPAARDAIEQVLFAETTTFGVRAYAATRRKLARAVETVQTAAGAIRIKVGRRQGKIVTAAAEYEDCRTAAVQTGRPLRAIMDQAMRAWQAQQEQGGGNG